MDGVLCSGKGRRTMTECSSDASETECLLNVKPEVILGSLTAGYVISDDCQTTWLHNTGMTPNLGGSARHESARITKHNNLNTKRQTQLCNNIMQLQYQAIASRKRLKCTPGNLHCLYSYSMMCHIIACFKIINNNDRYLIECKT